MSKPTIEQAFPTHAYCSIIPISADSFTNRRLPWVCDTYVGVPQLGRLCWESGYVMHNQTRSVHGGSLTSRAGG